MQFGRQTDGPFYPLNPAANLQECMKLIQARGRRAESAIWQTAIRRTPPRKSALGVKEFCCVAGKIGDNAVGAGALERQ